IPFEKSLVKYRISIRPSPTKPGFSPSSYHKIMAKLCPRGKFERKTFQTPFSALQDTGSQDSPAGFPLGFILLKEKRGKFTFTPFQQQKPIARSGRIWYNRS
ncbi:MAG: hypothetical protein II836_01020, partial [Clostridia bacterium]|nr:hypothetical protein [Clostridia bacterium]